MVCRNYSEDEFTHFHHFYSPPSNETQFHGISWVHLKRHFVYGDVSVFDASNANEFYSRCSWFESPQVHWPKVFVVLHSRSRCVLILPLLDLDCFHPNTFQFIHLSSYRSTLSIYTYSVVLVRKRTIPIERPPLVSEVSANFYG
jgi:hypothetical protein